MIDTHCHLTLPQFDADRDMVLRRARAAGISAIVNPGTDVEQSRAAVTLAEREPDIFAAVGVHPQDVGELTERDVETLRALARSERVVAIGEVGLEQSARSPELDVQRHWLERFVVLADDLRKPVIFHVRDAHAPLRSFLETRARNIRGVVHCFSGSLEDARFYVERGLSLGVTGIVTFPNAAALRAVLRALPLKALLVETDAPFLAPQTYRGKQNEPAYVTAVAEALAELLRVPLAEVEAQTDENARHLFGVS